ncbi:MAG: hypothetical protein ACR2JY_03830 [Chloroflexota bacterium]
MRRCSNCQFDNLDDAKVCARCGQGLVLTGAGTAGPDVSPVLPAWMHAVQTGTDSAPARSAAPTGASPGSVAAAATLPVQVRRSRGPILSVNGAPRQTVAATPAGAVLDAGMAPSISDGAALPKRRSRRLHLILLIALIIAVLAFLVIRHGV